MIAPRIEVDLGKIRHNTQCLVERLKLRGISITGVTKAVCGHPAIARAMLDGGAVGLTDARISNIERLRKAGITCPISMIRTPMLSQVDQVVRNCTTSYNTEMDIIAGLSTAAIRTDTIHNIVLMIEMGDMREGIMPENLVRFASQALKWPGISLKGIGANFACLSGVAPDAVTMSTLSSLATYVEAKSDIYMETISGGSSVNLPWAFGCLSTGRINNLRLGEAILLGIDPTTGQQIDGLYQDAFSLIAEVIETKAKSEPSPLYFADPALTALRLVPDNVPCMRSIVAIGLQDTDVTGLTLPSGITCLGATSDHLIVQTTRSQLSVGSELRMQMNYSALMRAMNAPDITKVQMGNTPLPKTKPKSPSGPHLELV